MNERHGEKLSALLDDEIDGAELEGLVTDILSGDRELLERFGRYRLVGDLIRDEGMVVAPGLAERVSAALSDEPTVLAPRPRKQAIWARPAAGLAVAASVAAAAVMVAPQFLGPSEPVGGSQLAALPAPAALVQPVVANAPQPPAGTTARWQALDPALEARLNRMLMEHQEFGGRTGVNGPVAHIGFVSYEAR